MLTVACNEPFLALYRKDGRKPFGESAPASPGRAVHYAGPGPKVPNKIL